jgi:hypothetical protein
LPFKCNLQRYSAVQQNLFQYDKFNETVWSRQKRSVVGLCRLNQVDP